MGSQAGLVSAFLAGVISFLSPCVLPLVPAYLSFLAGTGLEALQGEAGAKLRGRVLRSALAFVLGFTLVFVLLGASATFLGKWLLAYSRWFERGAGVLLFVLGLHVAGWVRIPFLMYEKRVQAAPARVGLVRSFVVGAAFAFGWTPCVGPILAGILALAGTQETVFRGMALLAVYSAGLGLPFLLAAAAVDGFLSWMKRFRPYLHAVEVLAGILLMAIGVVMFLGRMAQVSGWFGALGGLSL
jgi:cytochrome c-type biogenesis protein